MIIMSLQLSSEKHEEKPSFWDNATKYASTSKDESFVEISYLLKEQSRI